MVHTTLSGIQRTNWPGASRAQLLVLLPSSSVYGESQMRPALRTRAMRSTSVALIFGMCAGQHAPGYMRRGSAVTTATPWSR